MTRAAQREPMADAGFTLVELLVCLGILAVIAAMLSQGLALVRRGATVLDQAEAADTLVAVRAHLGHAIANALRVQAVDAHGTPRLAFSGEPQRLRFIARSNGRLEGAGLVVVEFGLEEHGGRRTLLTRRGRLPTAAGGDLSVSTFNLIEHVESLTFRYFGRLSQSGGPQWHDHWDDPDLLPDLIEIRLGLDEDLSRREWVPLVARVAG